MNRSRIIFCLLPLIMFASAERASADGPPGQVAISPSLVELSVDDAPINGSIRMQNLKSEALTVKVEVFNWTLDERNDVKLLPGDPQSLDQWLLISPLFFTIEPGGNQVIRYSVRPGVKPEPGEHRAMIYLSEQGDSQGRDGQGFKIRFRYGLAMYGHSGSRHESAEIEGLSLDKGSLAFKAVVRNTGNIHTRLTGTYALWKPGSFPGFRQMKNMIDEGQGDHRPEGLIATGSLHGSPILPGQRRTITELLGVAGPKGGCEVAIIGKIGGCRIEKLFQ